MSNVKDFIGEELLIITRFYGETEVSVDSPSIEQLWRLRFLCDKEIAEYNKEKYGDE